MAVVVSITTVIRCTTKPANSLLNCYKKSTMIRYTLILILLMGISWSARAQSPVPAPAQSGPIAIVGATAHLGNGEVIENSLIAFVDGRITTVDRAEAKIGLENYATIDATGKHVYPGFIATNTQLGLTEIGAVRATHDEAEVGSFNPNTRALIAYNTDSQVTPTVRSRGVLYAQVVPTSGFISGSSSIVNLDAWNWEDATISTDEGVHMRFPRRRRYSWRAGTWRVNEQHGEQMKSIEDFLTQAKAYCAGEHTERNLRLDAMCGLFSGDKQLYVHVDGATDIEQAIVFANRFAVEVVIVGGAESYLVTDVLKAAKVPVILGPMHALPNTLDSDVDQVFRTPALLHEAGVDFCLSNDGYWQQRNLPFQAGSAVAYGLPYEAAVQAITLDAARILGVEKEVGSLEVGKAASLIITSGDALDMRTNTVERAFLDGRDVDLDNKQEVLYRKFKTKYERG